MVTSSPSGRLKIAYAIQNVGGIDFRVDIGDTVPVKQSLLGLQRRGHQIRVFRLAKQQLLTFSPESFQSVRSLPGGVTDGRLFHVLERAGRRLQKILGIPYYAVLDSYRFYSGCVRAFPGYDLCHEHNGLFCIGAAMAARRLGLPYVLTFSADLFLERELLGRPLRGLHARAAAAEARYTYRLARAVICVSNPARDHLVERWQVDPEKIHVLPNGVDTDVFVPAGPPDPALRQKYGLEGARVIAFAGGFQPWHGLDLLVRSFAKVLNEIPDARLLLIGDGRARRQVEAEILRSGVGDRVVITGLVPQEQVPPLLALADVAVLPYPELPNELWFSPLKLYEYMAAGSAIVASGAGQIAEVVKDGYNGVLVNPGDVGGLTRALIGVLNDPELRRSLGRNARKQAVERHSWDQYVDRLEGVYDRALRTTWNLSEN